ncbi:hypothetical protein [Streptomyces sp. GESEQ-35]|uniref:hypothetical protein n=1 Tax=Streptomyces sp. GESEQ-35 TaxID=2812657 RepID=UPI001B3281E2|nr:hypothetical protein [Streptomyces sp. GESEQ-35]
MGPLKATLCAGAAIFAALTPAAHAADGGGISVTPTSPAPGSDISLTATGCGGATGTAVSAAFVADARLTGAGGTLVGETRVSSSITAGTYDVQVTCVGVQGKAALTVVAKTEPQTQTHPPASLEPTSAASSPVAPVQAGGGGTARLAAKAKAEAETDSDTDEAGPGTGHAVTGLVLAGVAAVAVALRSVRRSRGTD